MSEPRPTRILSSRAIAWICLAAVAAIAWWNFDRNPSPGPLHPSHAGVVSLQGNDGCRQCHAEGRFDPAAGAGREMAAACNTCHDRIADQITRHTGIHGTLEGSLAFECSECHHEHAGDTLGLVSLAVFQKAGIGAPELYDHAHVGGLKLTGKHLELECAGCHVNARNDMIAEGQSRFLGLTQQCTGCHNDVHKGELGNDCARCHGQSEPFKAVPSFTHPKTFPLVDGHAHRKCSECHTTPGEYKGLSVACASCHTDDFERTTRPSHRVARIGTDCASCHDAVKWTTVRFTHDQRFPLAGKHAAVACATCHSEGAPQQEVLAFEKGAGCAACHTDDFERTTRPSHRVAGLGTDCASCHGVDDWKAKDFVHDQRFPLIGAHKPLACNGCHAEGDAQRKVVAFTANASCEACHASPHDAKLMTAVRFVRGVGTDACAVCHLPAATNWRDADARMTVELHAATGFELAAPHDKQSCAKCHPGVTATAAAAATTLRTEAQWKADFPGRRPDGCDACHKDPHGGQFKNADSAGGGACIACHARTAFMPTRFDASMHAKCAFPLDGSHRAVACGACHEVVDGVRRFVGTKSACVACHKDIHDGAFDRAGKPATVNGKSDCARCHTTENFARITWTAADHATWTGEVLTGRHATASCNECHRREKPRGRAPAPFKPAPKECAACHEDVHAGQFLLRDEPGATTDCARCHKSTESFAPVAFDHQKDSRFPLDADHAKLACAACHKPVDVAGRAIVRYKPLGVKCADCHDPRTLRPRPVGEPAAPPKATEGGEL